ncbi:MAG: VapB-type antitoxin [Candidatus Bathyarchaeia archaeon]|nr:VapB-type antitoxin [Candidatus Bathyarchaeota archaeon]
MAIVKIDERGRMSIPKKMGIKSTKAIIIPAGSFFVTIPLPIIPYQYAGSWLTSKRERAELKELAEKLALEEAVKRARRRKQI